jgi:SAM-dependent methyltransferase
LNSDIYDYPELYDALLPVRAHLPYYMELARQASGEVLELACGTGQLTVPIASAGLPIAGLDLSAPMVNRARERAAAAKVPVEHSVGDMRNFDLGRQFRLIFIARNSLLHLHSTEDFVAAFAAIRRHLAPGAMFAFDIFNTNMQRLARPAGQRFPVMQVETELFGTLSVEETSDYDAATQVNRGRWYVSAPGKPDAWTLQLALRASFRRSCRCCSRQAGFISRVAWENSIRRRSIPTAVRKCVSARRQFNACRLGSVTCSSPGGR